MRRIKHKYDLSNRRRKKKSNKILFFIFAILAAVGGIIFLLRINEMRIREISVVSSGENLVAEDEAEIKEKVGEVLSGNYFFIIPKNSVFFYPQKELREKLLKSFPSVANLNIEASPWEGLLIRVEPRLSSALWCRAEECFSMDSHGFIFEKVGASAAGFKFEGLLTGDPLGRTFGDASLISFMKDFVDKLSKLGLNTLLIKVYNEDKAEAILDNGSFVIFSPKPDAGGEVADNLSLLINNLKEKNGGTLPELQYVDTRYGNKLFYKLK